MSTSTIKKGRPYFQFADSNGRACEYSSSAAAIRAAKRDYPEESQPTIYRVDYTISSDGYVFGELYTQIYPRTKR